MRKNLKCLGLHLAGAGTKKTALVRATLPVESFTLPLSILDPSARAQFQAFLPKILRDLPVNIGVEGNKTPLPMIWEAAVTGIGSLGKRHPDEELIELLTDLGGADILCLDAPTYLPSCIPCTIPCPGVLKCGVPEVAAMRNVKVNAQPYAERFFEVFAKANCKHPSISGSFEFESVLGSGKAPLSARARYLIRRIKAAFPNVVVIETNAPLNAVGWSMALGNTVQSYATLRAQRAGFEFRKNLFAGLETQKLGFRGGAFHPQLFSEVQSNPHLFAAAMSCFALWGLVNGRMYVHEDNVKLGNSSFENWVYVPTEVFSLLSVDPAVQFSARN